MSWKYVAGIRGVHYIEILAVQHIALNIHSPSLFVIHLCLIQRLQGLSNRRIHRSRQTLAFPVDRPAVETRREVFA